MSCKLQLPRPRGREVGRRGAAGKGSGGAGRRGNWNGQVHMSKLLEASLASALPYENGHQIPCAVGSVFDIGYIGESDFWEYGFRSQIAATTKAPQCSSNVHEP